MADNSDLSDDHAKLHKFHAGQVASVVSSRFKLVLFRFKALLSDKLLASWFFFGNKTEEVNAAAVWLASPHHLCHADSIPLVFSIE